MMRCLKFDAADAFTSQTKRRQRCWHGPCLPVWWRKSGNEPCILIWTVLKYFKSSKKKKTTKKVTWYFSKKLCVNELENIDKTYMFLENLKMPNLNHGEREIWPAEGSLKAPQGEAQASGQSGVNVHSEGHLHPSQENKLMTNLGA